MAVYGQLARLRGYTGAGVHGQLAGLRGYSTPAVHGQLGGLRGFVSQSVSVDAGLGGIVNPFDTVELSASVTTTGSGAGSWVWSQVSGRAVTLLGSGRTRTYRAPAVYPDGDVLVFRATFQQTGLPDSSDTVTYTVRAHAGNWRVTPAGVLYGVPFNRRRQVASAPVFPGASRFPSATLFPSG